jgi:uncharacterized damage-inducible protein DinB
MNTDLRFPIGDFQMDFEVSPAARRGRIETIKKLPAKMRAAVDGLDDARLDTPYRPEGWTVRQTVHHVPDSHMNSMIRFKLALTEDTPPTIKPYMQERWAELGDSRMPIGVSLNLIDNIHARWVALLESMSDADYARTFIHPDTGEWSLDGALALYAWHSLHHTAHITRLRDRMGW